MMTKKEFLTQISSYLTTQIVPNSSDDNPSEMRELIFVFKELLGALISSNDELSDIRIQHIISHFEAIHHYQKVKAGKSTYYIDAKSEFKSLIQAGYDLLPEYQIKRENIESKIGGALNNRLDDTNSEKQLAKEQEVLDSNPEFHQFLHSIWRYAIYNPSGGYPSKKIFISYAWATGDEYDEAWTKSFVEKLARHLIAVGFQVYIDDIQSGAGAILDNFMNKIHKVDHVIVISSRTMAHKLGLPESGVSQENNKIKEIIKQFNSLTKSRWVIPVLLNYKNYCDPEFRGHAEVSFCNSGYRSSFCELIQRIYEAGEDFRASIEQNWLKRLDCSAKEKTLSQQQSGLKSIPGAGLDLALEKIIKDFGIYLQTQLDMSLSSRKPQCFLIYASTDLRKYPYEKWIERFVDVLRSHIENAGVIVFSDKSSDKYHVDLSVQLNTNDPHSFVVFGSESFGYKTKTEKRYSNLVCQLKLKINSLIPILLSGDTNESFPRSLIDTLTIEKWNELENRHYLIYLGELLCHIYYRTYMLINNSKPIITLDELFDQWRIEINSNQTIKTYLAVRSLSSTAFNNKFSSTSQQFFPQKKEKPPRFFIIERDQLNIVENAFRGTIAMTIKMVVLSGGGGVGKSTLAQEYKRKNESNYRAIHTLSADNNLIAYIQIIAEQLNIKPEDYKDNDPEQAERKLLYLFITKLTENGDWLLILDNVHKHKQIKLLLELINEFNTYTTNHNSKLHLLVTTRHEQHWDSYNFVKIVSIPKFELQQSATYIKYHFPKSESTDVDNLCVDLDNLPLLLTNAVNYIALQRITIQEFRKKLVSIPQEIFRKNFAKEEDYPLPVYQSLMMKFDDLLQKNNRLDIQCILHAFSSLAIALFILFDAVWIYPREL